MSHIRIYDPFLYKVVNTTVAELKNEDEANLLSAVIKLMRVQECECEQIRIYNVEYNAGHISALRAVNNDYETLPTDADSELVIFNFYILGQIRNTFISNNSATIDDVIPQLRGWRHCLKLLFYFYRNVKDLRPIGEFARLVERCLDNQYIDKNLQKYISDNPHHDCIQQNKSTTLLDLDNLDHIRNPVIFAAVLDNFQKFADCIIFRLCTNLIEAIKSYRTDLALVMEPNRPKPLEIGGIIVNIYTDALDVMISGRDKSDIPGVGVVEKLGKGGYGTAYKYTPVTVESSAIVIKKVNSSVLPNNRNNRNNSWLSRETFVKEIKNTRQLDHKNIIRYYDALFYDGFAFMVMEFGGISLHDKYYDHFIMVDTDIVACVRSVCRALSYLHNNVRDKQDQFLIHRDVRADNIVYSQHIDTYKLIDFGISRVVTSQESRFQSYDWGNSLWKSPEYCFHALNTGGGSGPKKPGKKVDMWSLGISTLEMKSYPNRPCHFEHYMYAGQLQSNKYMEDLSKGKFSPLQQCVQDNWKEDIKQILCRCLQVNDEDRCSAQQLLDVLEANELKTLI